MKKEYLVIFLIGAITLFLVFWVRPYLTEPVGVPLDFYDISDNLEKSNMEIYYLGRNIPLNERVSYTEIDTVLDVPLFNINPYKAIIIEFEESTVLSEDEIARLRDLYSNECYYVILLNYSGSGLTELIEDNDLYKDFIFLSYTVCGDLYESTSVDFPKEVDRQTIQYIITDQLENILE